MTDKRFKKQILCKVEKPSAREIREKLTLQNPFVFSFSSSKIFSNFSQKCFFETGFVLLKRRRRKIFWGKDWPKGGYT